MGDRAQRGKVGGGDGARAAQAREARSGMCRQESPRGGGMRSCLALSAIHAWHDKVLHDMMRIWCGTVLWYGCMIRYGAV